LQWLDNGKPLFIVRTKLVSTLYTQDQHLHAFFKHYSSERNDELLDKVEVPCILHMRCIPGMIFLTRTRAQAIKGIKQASGQAQVQFFPVLLNQLAYVMCNMSPDAAREAFLAIPVLLNRFSPPDWWPTAHAPPHTHTHHRTRTRISHTHTDARARM
jgi:hypothetical protein